MINVVKGVVSDLRQETKQRALWKNMAGNGPTPPTVRYEILTDFELDGKQVTIAAGPSLQLDNGDELIVAGFNRANLKGLAFKNLSKQVTWGNNLLSIVFALVLVMLSLIITPERLLLWRVIDFQIYRDFFSDGSSSFGNLSFPGRQLLMFLRIVAGVVGSISLITDLPKLISYMRIKDA